MYLWDTKSKLGRDNRKRLEQIRDIPLQLLTARSNSIRLGYDQNLKASIFLPDSIRRRHVHILGATGSGKTESVFIGDIYFCSLNKQIYKNMFSIWLKREG